MDRAMQHGFTYGDSSWGEALFTLFSAVLCLTMFLIANFGQGAPEGMINKYNSSKNLSKPTMPSWSY